MGKITSDPQELTLTDVQDLAQQAADSEALTWGARLGLTARGVIYLLMGALAVAIAFGRSTSKADQRGALTDLSQRTGGTILLIVLAAGFAGYALWRFSEVAFGVTGDGKGVGARAKSLLRALIYSSFAVSAVTILVASGDQPSQGEQQVGLTATVLRHTGGRTLVGLLGVAVVVAGLVMVYEGWTRKFMKYLRTGQMRATTHTAIRRLGTIGTIARGLVIALSGALVVQAAVAFDAEKAKGLDGALRTLAEQPYGKLLLTAAGLGLVVFGIYGLAEARWRRT